MLPNMCITNMYFPCTVDIYYSMYEQDEYGNEEATWVYDRTIPIVPQSVGDNTYDQSLEPGLYMKYDEGLMARVPENIRVRSNGALYPITEVVLVNIRDADGNIVYMNYSGDREGHGTVFGARNIDPSFDPFGRVDYYQLILQRAQDQDFIGVTNDDA